MSIPSLQELLARNRRHAESIAGDRFGGDHFADVQDTQRPAVVSVCCSDSRVSQEGMWDVDEPGWLFTPSTIGNQVRDRHEDEIVLEGSVCYPIVFTETKVAVVVGHTGCGAVTAALDAVRASDDGDATELPPGVEKWVELLVPIVQDGLADERVDPDGDASLVNQLVEYNVDEQVAFLRQDEAVPSAVDVYGFVYDFQGVYGDVPGRAYLVNANGETDVGTLRSLVENETVANETVEDEPVDHVERLL